jgi:prophage regulatory protein
MRKFLTEKEIKARGYNWSRAQRDRLIKDGKFPAPIRLSERKPVWIEAELDAWEDSLVAEREQSA